MAPSVFRAWKETRVTRSGHIPLALAVLAVLQFTDALHVPFWANLLICVALGLMLRPVFKRAGWTERKDRPQSSTETS